MDVTGLSLAITRIRDWSSPSIGPGGEESTSWKPSRLQGVGPMEMSADAIPRSKPKVPPVLLQLVMILDENGVLNIIRTRNMSFFNVVGG